MASIGAGDLYKIGRKRDRRFVRALLRAAALKSELTPDQYCNALAEVYGRQHSPRIALHLINNKLNNPKISAALAGIIFGPEEPSPNGSTGRGESEADPVAKFEPQLRLAESALTAKDRPLIDALIRAADREGSELTPEACWRALAEAHQRFYHPATAMRIVGTKLEDPNVRTALENAGIQLPDFSLLDSRGAARRLC